MNTTFPKVLVAQIGARRHYQQPVLFQEWGVLDKLYTDFYCQDSPLTRLLKQDLLYSKYPKFIKKSLERYSPLLATARVAYFPQLALKYNFSLKRASLAQKSLVNIQTAKEFCHKIIRSKLSEVDVVYGFDGACLELFEYAKTKGIKCVLDQTVAERSLIHRLLLEEENLWSGWSKHPFKVYPADIELAKRQHKEQQLADRIVCGSSFVKDSLVAKGIEPSKIFVVSLGDIKNKQTICRQDLSKNADVTKGINILFAGSVGLRKGIQYLLQALKQLKGKIPFSCKVAGLLNIDSEIVKEYSDVADFIGLVPRSQMEQLYSWADVFVLPSICEGSAMVTYEALSHQLTTITTHNTGSIVRHNIDGFVNQIRDSHAIAEQIMFLYENRRSSPQPEDIQDYLMSQNACAKSLLKKCLLTA